MNGLQHVENLLEQFEQVLNDLVSCEDREVNTKVLLLRAKHPNLYYGER